jgi:hypothetical protein
VKFWADVDSEKEFTGLFRSVRIIRYSLAELPSILPLYCTVWENILMNPNKNISTKNLYTIFDF